MKIKKENYPFKVIAEDRVSKTSLKPYQYISVGFTKRAKDWTEENKHYETVWFNFFDEADLLTLSTLCEAAYQHLVAVRQKEKEEQFQAKGM